MGSLEYCYQSRLSSIKQKEILSSKLNQHCSRSLPHTYPDGEKRFSCFLLRPFTRVRQSLKDDAFRCLRMSSITCFSFLPVCCSIASKLTLSDQANSITRWSRASNKSFFVISLYKNQIKANSFLWCRDIFKHLFTNSRLNPTPLKEFYILTFLY